MEITYWPALANVEADGYQSISGQGTGVRDRQQNFQSPCSSATSVTLNEQQSPRDECKPPDTICLDKNPRGTKPTNHCRCWVGMEAVLIAPRQLRIRHLPIAAHRKAKTCSKTGLSHDFSRKGGPVRLQLKASEGRMAMNAVQSPTDLL